MHFPTILGTISIRVAGSLCYGISKSILFEFEYEYTCNYVRHMNALEIFLHLKRHFTFQVE